MKQAIILLASACLLAGCADVDVQSVAASGAPLKIVYIQRNPAADEIAPDLESVIENGLQRHGIGTKIVAGDPPCDNDYGLTYSAISGWDLKPFLKAADVRIKRGARQVGYAHYQAGGGLSVSKFGSTRDKMDPTMDQLLAGFH